MAGKQQVMFQAVADTDSTPFCVVLRELTNSLLSPKQGMIPTENHISGLSKMGRFISHSGWVMPANLLLLWDIVVLHLRREVA